MDKKADLPQARSVSAFFTTIALEPCMAGRSPNALQVQQGSLYPALHRLAHKGLIRAKWDPAECPGLVVTHFA
jgi:PadR family transcriptional regulator, regulatory protein PadR